MKKIEYLYVITPSCHSSQQKERKTKQKKNNCYVLDLIVADPCQPMHICMLDNEYISNRVIKFYSNCLGIKLLDFEQKIWRCWSCKFTFEFLTIRFASHFVPAFFFSSSNFHICFTIIWIHHWNSIERYCIFIGRWEYKSLCIYACVNRRTNRCTFLNICRSIRAHQ